MASTPPEGMLITAGWAFRGPCVVSCTTARSCRYSAAKATAPAQAATRHATARSGRSRASAGTCARSTSAGRRTTTGQPTGGSVRRPAHAVHGPRARWRPGGDVQHGRARRALGARPDPAAANAWTDLYDPNRLSLRAAAPSLLKKNAEVGLHFVGDRLRRRAARTPADLQPGEGDLVRHAGEIVAGTATRTARSRRCRRACTRLGCRVTFNTAERGWELACHGVALRARRRGPARTAVHRLRAQTARLGGGIPQAACWAACACSLLDRPVHRRSREQP